MTAFLHLLGLVRGGVAPDHPKIKSVTKLYDRIAANPNFRFFGHVEYGTDIVHDDLIRHYHATIYAVGAQTDRRMDIPGEDLPGSHPATEFVAWYNAHPDFCSYEFDLSAENVAVIGLGNVAMDVIRILARTPEELAETDIADYALEALRHSNVKNIYVLGRRGPAQAAFTNPEIKELGELDDADVIVSPEEVKLDSYSQQYIDSGNDRVAAKNVEILKSYAEQGSTGKVRKIIMRFLVSPVEIIGDDRVEAIKIVKNELYPNDKGSLRPRPTGEYETIPVGLVFRSVGYQGIALPGVPFDEKSATIPNAKGRVLTSTNSRGTSSRRLCGGLDQAWTVGYHRDEQTRLSRNHQCTAGRPARWQTTQSVRARTGSRHRSVREPACSLCHLCRLAVVGSDRAGTGYQPPCPPTQVQSHRRNVGCHRRAQSCSPS